MPPWPVQRPPASPSSEVASDSDITILRISEEAEEDAELLVYLEQQGLMPGVRAHVAHVSQSRDSVTIDGPKGQSSMGLRPASLIRVLLGDADPSLFHQVPEAVARLGAGEPLRVHAGAPCGAHDQHARPRRVSIG